MQVMAILDPLLWFLYGCQSMLLKPFLSLPRLRCLSLVVALSRHFAGSLDYRIFSAWLLSSNSCRSSSAPTSQGSIHGALALSWSGLPFFF